MSLGPGFGGGVGSSGLLYGAGGGVPYVTPSLTYYLRLLTSEYQGKPNLTQWLTTVLQPVIDVAVLLGELSNAFDINSAVGPQLDVLGLLIGVSRVVPFQPSNPSDSPTLDDTTYRILLRAKIAQNQWNGQIGPLYSLWNELFPGGRIVLQDNQNMTATIFLAGSFTSIIKDLIRNGMIVPRPEGVLYTYTFATEPVFGFDNITPYIAGFDLGHWS